MSKFLMSEQEVAKVQYTRLLWKNLRAREVLVEHWLSPDHPYRERFVKHRKLIERLLDANGEAEEQLDEEFRADGSCFNQVAKEVPSTYHEAGTKLVEAVLGRSVSGK